jgi:hypothetical protein
MALTTSRQNNSPYADRHVKPYAKRHLKVYADSKPGQHLQDRLGLLLLRLRLRVGLRRAGAAAEGRDWDSGGQARLPTRLTGAVGLLWGRQVPASLEFRCG